MTQRGESTLSEILSQPSVWQSALHAFDVQAESVQALLDNGHFERVIFTGCGSTHYLSMTAGALGLADHVWSLRELLLTPVFESGGTR